MREDRKLKKRKTEHFSLFSYDIITEITKYIDKIQDYFNLSLTNKYIFNLMMKENINSLNEIFKRNEIILEDFPLYLSKRLNCIYLKNKSDFTLLLDFKNLTNLTICDVDVLDEDFKYLSCLTQLNIKNCKKITGYCFKYLKRLEILKIEEVNNIFEDNLVNLIKLKKLKIIIDPNSLQILQNLKINSFRSFKGNFLQHLKALQILKLKISRLTKILEENLISLTNLTELNLNNIKLSGKYLYHLINLKKLIFSEHKEFKEEYLNNLINLEYLNLSNNSKFTGKYLNKFERLSYLDASGTNIEDNYLLNLKTNLTSLNISECDNITGECLLHLSNLTYLNISYTNILENYLVNLINLKQLNIMDCSKIIEGKFILNLNKLQSIVSDNGCFNRDFILKLKSIIQQENNFVLAINQLLKNK